MEDKKSHDVFFARWKPRGANGNICNLQLSGLEKLRWDVPAWAARKEAEEADSPFSTFLFYSGLQATAWFSPTWKKAWSWQNSTT
jgi:hypothetical protein